LKSAFTELQKINQIQLSLDNGHGVSEYQTRIQGLINDFEKYGVSEIMLKLKPNLYNRY